MSSRTATRLKREREARKGERQARKKGGLVPRVQDREVRRRYLIVCEGEKTEPNYFRAFRVNADVKIHGIGANTLSVVQEAERFADKDGPYDEVWCVFDRDSFPAQRFNAAIAAAKHCGFEVAYSNEAFELWYLLHFDYIDTGLSRHEYGQRLSRRLGQQYKKNATWLYGVLLSLQPAALRNAKQLKGRYQPPNPEQDNPSTTVCLLVKSLNANEIP